MDDFDHIQQDEEAAPQERFRTTRSLRDEQELEALAQAKRRREKQRKNLKRLLHWGVILGVLAALAVVAHASLGPVRLSAISDAGRSVGRRGEGFPVDFSHSHTRQAALVGRNLALLGPTQFDILNSHAYRLVEFTQPYPQPSIRAANGRVVLFDRTLGMLTLFSQTGTLASMDLQRGIFNVDLGARGHLAVAVQSDAAAAEIFVFDPNQRQVFGFRCELELPSAVRLSDNGSSLAMCLIGTQQAGIYARFVDFQIGATEPRTDLRIDSTWLYDTAHVSGGWLAVGDQAVYLIHYGAAQPLTASYEGRALHQFYLQNNGYSAILLDDWDNRSLLRVYDRNGSLVLEQSFAQRPHGVTARGRAVYLHFDGIMLRWQQRGGFRQSQALPPGTQEVLVAGRQAYLLTVRQAEQMRLRWSAADAELF